MPLFCFHSSRTFINGVSNAMSDTDLPAYMTTSIRVLAILTAAAIVGCGGSGSSTKDLTTEERFKKGMEELADENYQKAQELFEVILLQDPASEYADDAQFYLAESFYRQEEYRVAAFHYSRVLNDFPGSPLYKQALYMTGECYYKVSPQFERDQSQTETAIRQYRAFLQYFPSDTLAQTVQQRIVDLRTRLAQRDYSVAQQYLDRGEFKAAEIYFQRVIERYPETVYYQLALQGSREAQEGIASTEVNGQGS